MAAHPVLLIAVPPGEDPEEFRQRIRTAYANSPALERPPVMKAEAAHKAWREGQVVEWMRDGEWTRDRVPRQWQSRQFSVVAQVVAQAVAHESRPVPLADRPPHKGYPRPPEYREFGIQHIVLSRFRDAKPPIDLGKHPVKIKVEALHESGEGWLNWFGECAYFTTTSDGHLFLWDVRGASIGEFAPGEWRDLVATVGTPAHLRSREANEGHFLVEEPCPRCGRANSIFGYYFLTQDGKHAHTHYVCTSWPTAPPGTKPGDPAWADRRCGWHGWSVPDKPEAGPPGVELHPSVETVVCPLCEGSACEYGCGRNGVSSCERGSDGPDSHRVCNCCRGRGSLVLGRCALTLPHEPHSLSHVSAPDSWCDGIGTDAANAAPVLEVAETLPTLDPRDREVLDVALDIHAAAQTIRHMLAEPGTVRTPRMMEALVKVLDANDLVQKALNGASRSLG